jgi:UDP-N-acetylmuramate dehydrogenase
MKYFKKELLKKHTSFKIGGPAECYCTVKTIEDVKQALKYANDKKMAVSVIGAGTNLLISDDGIKGLVINISRGLNGIKIEDDKIVVGSGVMLQRLIRFAAKKSLGGLEFLAGVPGSVGGAILMNAGAWGKTIGKYVKSVKVLDHNGNEKIILRKDMGFAYRKSILQGVEQIVVEVVLKLRKMKKKTIEQKIAEFVGKRKNRHPLGSPNCGSVFKNPEGKIAAILIEDAGCKGMRIGDAQVSMKHANFIVNLGDAKASDVVKLITVVQGKVKTKHRIKLEPEVKIMVESKT